MNYLYDDNFDQEKKNHLHFFESYKINKCEMNGHKLLYNIEVIEIMCLFLSEDET